MRGKFMKSSTTFELHINGSNEIDAKILSRTLEDIAVVMNQLAINTDPKAFFKLKITAIDEGCFQIDFNAVCELAAPLLAMLPELSNAASFSKTVFECFKQYLDIKKALSGTKPASSEPTDNGKYNITTHHGDSYIVNGPVNIILSNPNADQHISDLAQALLEHNPDGGFFLREKGGKGNSDYIVDTVGLQNIAKELPIETTCQKITSTEIMEIKKPDLTGHSAWTFKLGKKTIMAKVEDSDWLEQLHNREFTIACHDYIQTQLETLIELSPNGIPDEKNIRYTIIKVIRGPFSNSDTEQESLPL